uniref:Methylcytosine dioxygenase TET n=1 Tax=Meloidogyne hapla TaxID=6305 RepID=A0A1I8BGC1_MELHA
MTSQTITKAGKPRMDKVTRYGWFVSGQEHVPEKLSSICQQEAPQQTLNLPGVLPMQQLSKQQVQQSIMISDYGFVGFDQLGSTEHTSFSKQHSMTGEGINPTLGGCSLQQNQRPVLPRDLSPCVTPGVLPNKQFYSNESKI